LWLAVAWSPAGAAEPAKPPVSEGKQLFDRWCGDCHAPGPGSTGTQQLARTRGESFAALEQRRDLTAEWIRYVVRNGLNAMPQYRPSEISDAELQAIAKYLTQRDRKKK
jgi:mono/diheme cytochrome c family protein